MLENLYLQVRGCSTHLGILDKGHWPRLRRLTIAAISFLLDVMDTEATSLVLRPFLSRHTNLERLYISGGGIDPRSVFTSNFPRLRSLHLPLPPSHDIADDFPYDKLSQLETLTYSLRPEHIGLLRKVTSLHACSILWSKGVLSCIRGMDQLQRLHLQPSFAKEDSKRVCFVLF